MEGQLRRGLALPTGADEARLNEAVLSLRASRLRKIARQPVNMTRSKALELACRRSGRSIERTATTFWGEDMMVVFPDLISIAISRYGFWEEGLTRFLLGRLRKGMTFVDVCAYIGYFTLLASRLVGPEGRVHCFEPAPTSFRILLANVSQRTNVAANRVAAWSDNTELVLSHFGPELAAFDTVFPTPRLTSRGSQLVAKYTITAVRLDDYVNSRGLAPSVIKIDAESAEFEVLRGLTATIEKHRPIITLEVGDFGIEGAPASRDVIEFVLERGYMPFQIQDRELVPHLLKERYDYDNVMLLPQ